MTPMEPPGAARPDTVTAASVLWIVLGSMLSLGAIVYLGSPQGANVSLAAITLVVALGVLFIVLGVRLRHGRDTRVILTVLGGALSIAIWPALLAVPAIVLQFRPSGKAWFESQRSASGR